MWFRLYLFLVIAHILDFRRRYKRGSVDIWSQKRSHFVSLCPHTHLVKKAGLSKLNFCDPYYHILGSWSYNDELDKGHNV